MTPKAAKDFFEQLKTAHELPNDNSGQYNIGYVDAMNTAINTVKKLILADVVNCSSCKYQMNGTTEPCRSCICFSNHTPK